VSPSADSTAVIALTTIGASADARALARTLVEERLAACINILPVMTSVYRWKSAVEEGLEQQLLIKTTSHRIEALRARLHELHSYDLPEFIVVPVSGGSAAYLEWVTECVKDSSERAQSREPKA
jgi:periplasmic divalent cation tolerance protein